MSDHHVASVASLLLVHVLTLCVGVSTRSSLHIRCCFHCRLISYELLHEEQSSKERMRVIISSQFLYFFQQSPPDLSSLDSQISLDELTECKPSTAKTSKTVSSATMSIYGLVHYTSFILEINSVCIFTR